MLITTLDRARDGLAKYGALIDAYRAEVPRSLLAYWIASETAWDRLCVSRDPVLIECGWSQVPLDRARALNADPFDLETGAWVACAEAVSDARRWSHSVNADGAEQPWCDWLTPPCRGLWWVTQMDYSIGGKALRRILTCAIARAEAQKRTPANFDLLAAVADWLAVADLASPHHLSFWGRQTPDQIRERCQKGVDWLDAAEKIAPLVGGLPGGEPPGMLPTGCRPFPSELIHEADVCADPDATHEQHAAARLFVHRYAELRRSVSETAPPVPVLHRILTALRPTVYRRRQGVPDVR